MNTEQEIIAIKAALIALSGFISGQFPHAKLDEFLFTTSKKTEKSSNEAAKLLKEMAECAASQRGTSGS